ncbi:MAG: TRL-like family protein [Planctomycetota bacterium]
MKRIAALCALAGCLAFAGCHGIYYNAPVVPPQGLIFSNTAAPVDTNAQGMPVAKKTGYASTHCVLGLFAFGDASIQRAAEDGGLSKVYSVDHEFFNLLFIYQSFTIRAHGE